MKIKLFTHTDLDGIGCAILAYLAFGRENVDVEYCGYDDVDENVIDFFETNTIPYKRIFITDISVGEETAKEIDSRTWKEKLNLFDHHATALYLNQYEWCEVKVEMDTGIKTSGTELFWNRLDQYGYFDTLGKSGEKNLTRFAEIVRDYDTWRWKELGEEGLVCKQVNDLFHIYGRENFNEWVMDQLTKPEPELKRLHGELFAVLDPNDRDQLQEPFLIFPCFTTTDQILLVSKQKDIDRYIEKKDKQLMVQTDAFGYTYGVIFAEQYFSELGNRLCELHPELDYVAMIDICGGKVSYRTVREDLDVGGTIAHSFGGGGHQKAAGSTFDGWDVRDLVVREVFG